MKLSCNDLRSIVDRNLAAKPICISKTTLAAQVHEERNAIHLLLYLSLLSSMFDYI